MQLKRQLFDSRVAQRIFALFLVVSLVPLLALGWLLMRQVGNALEEQAFEQLENTSRSYGQFALDKLLSAADLLHGPDSLLASSDADSGVLGIEALSVTSNGEQTASIGNWVPPFGPDAIAADKPTVAVVPGERGNDVVIAVRDGERAVFARLDRSYALRTDALLGRGMEACLFAAAPLTAAIHCSAELPATFSTELFAARQRTSAGRLTWSSGGETWFATYWQLFLPSRFAAEPWTVVVTVPRDTALASLAIFNRVVPQAAVVTLVLISILAIGQIQRTLNPLKELLAGTRRIAARDFATPVRVPNRDEFGVLGSALNGMAEQLEHQFGELRALADIDRSILQTTAIEPVLDTLFDRLATLVPGGRHLVLIIDPDNPGHGHVYRSQPIQTAEIERIKVTSELRDWLRTLTADRLTDCGTLESLGINFAGGRRDQALHVAPMLAGDTVAGALVTANGAAAPLAEREIGSLRELAARVTVAVSAGKREAELFRRAHFDALTGLPNRELLDDRLSQAVAQAQREGHPLAVLFVDLDGFKEVNDRLGHGSGDELLKETALRLTAAVRDADTVARLGGDEYAILLPQVQGPLEAEAVAVKAIGALRRPYVLGGREAYVSASIGLAVFPDDGETAAELLRKADMAMYNAKDAGKSCFRFFAEEMDRRLHERHSLHHDLRKALDAGEFTLAYQPQIDLRTGQLVSAEALLRWQHPLRGPMSPALFVPILEETGLIKEAGAWVLRQALDDFAAWQRAGLPLQRVAVNVSPRQLFDRDFVDTALEAIARAGLVGRRLEVELTEASLVDDFRAANDVLRELGRNGIRIALDDFGTGYSSLAYLNELVFDALKIDRAFVVNLPADKAVAIVKAIIAVADALGKDVVAEGIDSQRQCTQLMALGCELGQGYRLCKPLSSSELVAWSKTLAARDALADTAQRRRLSVGGT